MQKTFSELEYAGKKKLTRRDRFLADLEQLVPLALLEAQVAPFYADGTAGDWLVAHAADVCCAAVLRLL